MILQARTLRQARRYYQALKTLTGQPPGVVKTPEGYLLKTSLLGSTWETALLECLDAGVNPADCTRDRVARQLYTADPRRSREQRDKQREQAKLPTVPKPKRVRKRTPKRGAV